MSKYKYFSYSDDQGFETFTTAEEAKESAQDALDHYQDNASEGWDIEVENIYWGEIKQTTKEINVRTVEEAAEEGIYVSSDCSGVSEFVLEDL